MTISDLSKLGEPIKKLIEVIGEASTVLFEPTRIKRNSEAEASAIKTIAKAKVDAMILADERLRNYYLKIQTREEADRFRKQNNRDEIVLRAAEELRGKPVEDEPVAADWVAEFFKVAENISDSNMQLIWARILSKETREPGTFSIRAINTLRLMSYSEAQALKLIGEYSIRNNINEALFPSAFAGEYFTNKYSEYALKNKGEILHSLGLISIFNLPRSINLLHDNSKKFTFNVAKSSVEFTLSKPMKNHDLNIQGQSFTPLGLELLELIEHEPEVEYLKYLSETLKRSFNDRGIKASYKLMDKMTTI